MDWKTFVAELVKALAWPGLVGIGLFTYRRAILSLLAALIRILKRTQSLKYGDLVIATQSVSEAIEAKEAEAENAAIAMTQPDATQADREQLAAKLRDAVEESTRLKATLENLQAKGVEKLIMKFSPAARHRARTLLILHLLSIIGGRDVLRFSQSNQISELEKRVNSILQEARQTGNNTPGISTTDDLVNKDSGLIDEHGNITPKGIKELVSRADPLRRSGALETLQAV